MPPPHPPRVTFLTLMRVKTDVLGTWSSEFYYFQMRKKIIIEYIPATEMMAMGRSRISSLSRIFLHTEFIRLN
jgi:hypothetical protein